MLPNSAFNETVLESTLVSIQSVICTVYLCNDDELYRSCSYMWYMYLSIHAKSLCGEKLIIMV